MRDTETGQGLAALDARPDSRLTDESGPAQRVAALESLLAAVVHDLRSPLAGIRALSEYGSLATGEARCSELFRRIIGEIDKMVAVITLVQSLAQNEPAALLPLSRVVEEVLEECEPLCRRQGVTLERGGASARLVSLRPGQFRLALRNLVDNAAHATRPGGRVLVALEDQEGVALVKVTDDGPGIPPELQPRLFHPFVSGREDCAGLGLYAVRKIVVDHHQGEVWYETSGRGTTFYLQLPADQSAAG